MKISTPLALALIAAALLVVGGIYYREYQKVAEPVEVTAEVEVATDATAPVAEDNLAFHTEEEWSVLQVAQYIADLGSLAQEKPLAVVTVDKAADYAQSAAYTVQWGDLKGQISVKDGVWNPASYQDWAKEVLKTPDPAPVPQPGLEFANKMLTPTFQTFAAENQRLSAFLQEHPDSPEGLVDAALLCGTIALNDYAGRYRDTRIPLNRMVAFLAASDALGLPADNATRRVAEALRLTLCEQQAHALASIKQWPPTEDTTLKEWAAILRLRNTCDWREDRAAALAGSLALKREYFRALQHAATTTVAMEFLEASGVKPDAGFWRIANESEGLSVSEMHTFTKPMLEVEIAETGAAAKDYGLTPRKDNLEWLKDMLDTPEGSPVTADGENVNIQVAGRNLMGGYLQRHFMQANNALYGFFKDSWAVSDQAQQLKEFITGTLPAMRYTPFLNRMIARTDADRRTANTACEVVIREHPEMVTSSLWNSLCLDEDLNSILPTPDFHAWFHPEVPRGTAYQSGARLYEIGVGDENDAAWLRTLWERSPYNFWLSMHNAYLANNRSYDNLSGDIIAQWLQPQLDYSIPAIHRLASALMDQPERYEAAMLKVAAVKPDAYEAMGEYFRERGLDDKAAEYYLLSFEKADNRVLVANTCGWLVKYLFKKGDIDLATKVASDAADTYSRTGLGTYCWLMEAQGRWDEALETSKKIDERYNNGEPSAEVGCLIRLSELSMEKAKHAGYDEKVAHLFPDGMQKVTLADFQEAPTQGVLINGTSDSLEALGLARGMVVTALDGYRVNSFSQYGAIRDLTADPNMTLVVWDGKSYRESKGEVPNRRFNIDMIDYAK